MSTGRLPWPSSARRWARPTACGCADCRSSRSGLGRCACALRAAGINFPDVLMIQGLYQHRPELPFVPGVEAAGVVAEVAPDVSGIRVGDKVIARMRTGGLRRGGRRAGGPDHAAAAWVLVRGRGHVSGGTHQRLPRAEDARRRFAPGETLLVLGAAGGVGLAAVQLGKALGARVLAAASSAEKLEAAVRHGADGTIDYAERARRGRREAPHVGQGRRRGARSRRHRAGVGAAMPRARRQAADRRVSRAAPSPPTPPTASCSRARP